MSHMRSAKLRRFGSGGRVPGNGRRPVAGVGRDTSLGGHAYPSGSGHAFCRCSLVCFGQQYSVESLLISDLPMASAERARAAVKDR